MATKNQNTKAAANAAFGTAAQEVAAEAVQAFDLATVPASTPAPLTETVIVDGTAMIASLTSAQVSYCSMSVATDTDKVAVYNAMSNAKERLTDHIGEEIDMRNVYIEAINCTNTETGETNTCPRIVIIDKNGVTYQAVSMGIFGSLRQIFQMFGDMATWNFALRVKVKQVRTRNGFTTNTLEAVKVIPD